MSSERSVGCRPRVLVIDDDAAVLRAMARRLRSRYTVVALTSVRRAIDLIEAGLWFDAVICQRLTLPVASLAPLAPVAPVSDDENPLRAVRYAIQ